MTAPHDISDRVSGRQDDLRIDAWALCAEFIEWIVAEARASEELCKDLPEVDWEGIWSAGEGASSDELAMGRIVRAASEAVGKIALDRPKPLPADGPTGDRFNAAVTGDASVLTRPPEVPDDPGVRAEPPSDAVVPVVAPDDRLISSPESSRAEFQPLGTITESVTEPVDFPPDSVDPLEATRPQSPSPEHIAAVHTQEVPLVVPAPLPDTATSGEPEHGPVVAVLVSRHSAGYHVFTWMRNIGAILLLFVVWQLWGTDIAQHHAQSQLKTAFETELRAHRPPVAVKPGSLISATTRFSAAADGSVLARLQIPAIGVDQYVVEGTSASDLAKGPGHYVGTALPGQAGNVSIAGHRTTHGAPFNGLGHLVRGDRVILTTSWGEHLTYRMSGTPLVVSPSDVAVLNYFRDNRITLTTCNPEYSSSQRLVAVGILDQRVHAPEPTKAIAYHIPNSDTSSWNFSMLPTVGVEVCLLLLLGLSYRYFGDWFKSGTKWLILVPLWAAGLYLLFGSLTMFFPTSI